MPLASDEHKEFWACLALKHTRGVGPRTWKRLLEAYGNAYDAVMDVASWHARGLARQPLADALRGDAWRAPAREEWDAVRRLGCGVLLHASPSYPQRLREIPDPPLFLYAQGECALLGAPAVAVVGTRQSTPYGREAAHELCLGLSRAGIVIVSGLAYGIDRQAHLAGLEGVGGSIAVLGAGLDSAYPAGNADVRAGLRSKGLLLTEYPPGCAPEARNFPVRNRIISGLSLGVVVVEASEKSGSMITARQALEQGREVFAVPGPRAAHNYSGCFTLINQGAKLICSSDDVLRELAPLLRPWRIAIPEPASPAAGLSSPTATQPAAPRQVELEGDEGRLFAALRQDGQLHIDTLGQRLDWEAARVSRILLLLEMRGLVRQLPGMIYSVV